MTYRLLCTWRTGEKAACRCENGLRRDTPAVIVRSWKDGLKPELRVGDAICSLHGDEVPEWMVSKPKEKRR